MTTSQVAHWTQTLRSTLLTRTHPDPGDNRPLSLRRLRAVMLTTVALWAGFMSWLTTPGDPLTVATLTAATVTPALIAIKFPLPAWRLTLVLLLATPLIHGGSERLWGWPWTPALALALALVLFVVAESHNQATLVCVELITIAALAVHLRDWRDLALITALMTALIAFGNTLRQRRVAERKSREHQRERVAEETKAAVLHERARIARELHDVVAHHMSVLVLRTDSARYRIPELSEDALAEFADLRDTAREGMVEMRRLLGVLRTEGVETPIAPRPTADRVAELAETIRALDMPCTLATHGDFDALPAGVALSTYRIIQEALSNAARHATGSQVDIELDIDDQSVRISVRNSAGAVAQPAANTTPGHGILGMRERVSLFGGDLEAGPTGDGGFAVRAKIPVSEGGVS